MFDREDLIAHCRAHGRVVRVVVARVQGSAPREPGAAMLVWADGQSGTIGGGALEYDAAGQARALSSDRRTQHALGPDLGQCCGGRVELWSEVYDLDRAKALPETVIARGEGPMPFAVKRLIAAARSGAEAPATCLIDGWLVEPVAEPARPLWIWGAGHVGRALVDILHSAPHHRISWIDTAPERFPGAIPDGVTRIVAREPARLIPHAPGDADHLILTYSHVIDLELCHGLLGHGFASCGLIGSDTKWARFRSRLRDLGHSAQQIDRIACPIGDPALGKHPYSVAIGVAHQLAARAARKHERSGRESA